MIFFIQLNSKNVCGKLLALKPSKKGKRQKMRTPSPVGGPVAYQVLPSYTSINKGNAEAVLQLVQKLRFDSIDRVDRCLSAKGKTAGYEMYVFERSFDGTLADFETRCLKILGRELSISAKS
ncbi:MAG: hypothetical protein SP1CHLAM54_07640 [Chlamydiia bacterium]|nr:hypothetical protein [Chlamydiia bacterium]MCH9615670.1 hypothetical protein [Chlamydiia bacterium]MCH9628927.1 hypothetical protein [Chlamydiia bacterium]